MKLNLKKIITFIAIIFVILFILYKFIPQRHIILGAWTEGLFDVSTQQLHPEKLQQFEKLIDKKVSIAHFYRGWEALSDPTLIKQIDSLQDLGWTPMLNVNPYFFSQCPASNLPLYKAVAQGKCDAFLHSAGKNLSHTKKPFYLLFAWEMNNNDLEWSVTKSGSEPADFIAAWRHVHTIFKQEKADNVLWVFCPNVPDNSQIPYSKIYPGNNYVDWVGLDGYNWGTTQSWSHWVSFSDVFTSSYKQLSQIAKDKPMVIAEVNTTNQGGDKSAWYTDMLTNQLPNNFPNIKAVVIYNEDRTSTEHVNWKVDITPETLRAFSSGIHSPSY